MNYKQLTPQGQPEDDRAVLHTSIKTLTITQFIYIKHNNHNHYNIMLVTIILMRKRINMVRYTCRQLKPLLFANSMSIPQICKKIKLILYHWDEDILKQKSIKWIKRVIVICFQEITKLMLEEFLHSFM